MPDRYIEKSFLYLLCISLLLHAAVFAALYFFPPARSEQPKEPVFIDLQQMPELKPQPEPRQQETKRLSEQRSRFERETAPRGEDFVTSPKSGITSRQATRPQKPHETAMAAPNKVSEANSPDSSTPSNRRDNSIKAGSSVASLLKSRNSVIPAQRPDLSIRGKNLSEIENSLYKHYQDEFETDHITRINADDFVYGSLYKRIHDQLVTTYTDRPMSDSDKSIIQNQIGSENSVYAIVVLTLNKNGDVLMNKTYILKSSGIRVLDDFILDSIRRMGPLGRLPKQHKEDELRVPRIFSYHLLGRMIR